MTSIRFVNTLLSIAFLAVLMISCKESAPAETTQEGTPPVAEQTYKEAPMIEPDEFEKGMKRNKAVIVDVRMPQEFETGHMEGAININFFDPNFKNQLLDLDKNKKYYFYCKNDSRSERAAEFLLQNDYPEAYVLKGGYDAWIAAGKK